MKKQKLTEKQEMINDFMLYNDLIARINISDDYFKSNTIKDDRILEIATKKQLKLINLWNVHLEEIETKYKIKLNDHEKLNGINLNYRVGGSIKVFIEPDRPKVKTDDQIKMEGLR